MLSQEEEWLLVEKYEGEKSKAFFTDLSNLHSGIPLAYIIGHIPFLDCKIYLDSKPLIPRPETEYWTEAVINEINTGKIINPRILDLCAGSGAIGVAIAKTIPSSTVDFIEIDESHLPTIEKNCLVNNIEKSRFRTLLGNLFHVSPEVNLKTYDFIVSNPPYIDPKLAHRTEVSVKDFEPTLALYGGKQGIELIEKIITESPNYLNINGQLWLEHEPEQIEKIKELAQNRFIVTIMTDQYKVPRFTKLVLQ